jgi:hypothetical protein
MLDISIQDVQEDFLEVLTLKEGNDTLSADVSNKPAYTAEQTRRTRISYLCMINYSVSSYSLRTPAINVKP